MSGLCGDCGAASGCGCVVTNGTITTVTGTGAAGSPYAVNVIPQPITWHTDVALSAHFDRDVMLWDVATSKWRNYRLDSYMAVTNTAAVPPGNSSTTMAYSAYSALATAVNNSGLTLNWMIVVHAFMAFNTPRDQQASVGFQAEINGVAQTEWQGSSVMVQGGTSTGIQCNGIHLAKAYNGNVAPGASVQFRVRAAWKQVTAGYTTSYQSALLDAILLMV